MSFEQLIYHLYSRWIVPRVKDPLVRQRLKLAWFVWKYWPMLTARSVLSLRNRIALLCRFIRIDWNVLHAHTPDEIAVIFAALSQRPAKPGEVVVEAGCWNGGSSAKFSLVCERLGYALHIYDSFQGVEDVRQDSTEWAEFFGQYASPEDTLRKNLERFGKAAIIHVHSGWFANTLAREGAPGSVRLAYIDCDLIKGTFEALSGLLPSLVDDGIIFSQDYHIDPVRRLLNDPATWSALQTVAPLIKVQGKCLAALQWPRNVD